MAGQKSDQRDNFFSWAYKQLSQNQILKIVKTQINTPTLVDDLAACITTLMEFSKSDMFHTTCPEAITRYDFVQKLIEIFDFDPSLLEETPELIQKAKRPRDSSLNTTKIQNLGIYSFKDISNSFHYLKENKNIISKSLN